MQAGTFAMAKMINLNADIAEGWGAYDIGNDAELMKIIKSASVACGFHAGDPNTMHRLCTLAKEQGVSVGAHPGFNDLWGFGRRRIQMKAQDLEYMVAYQIGALQAMAAYAGLKVTHLKAHGALNNMAAEDEGYAMAIGRAIKAVDRSIIYVALYGLADAEGRREAGAAAGARGLPRPPLRRRRQPRLAHDPRHRAQGPQGWRPSRRCAWCGTARSWRSAASASRSRCIRCACTATRRPVSSVARGIRQALEAADISVVPLPEMKL